MRNVVLFLVSVAIGYLGWRWLENPTNRTSEMIKLGVLAALFLPVNIKGNIFTLCGSVHSKKNAYSLFSPFQSADGDAISVFGAGYQRVGRNAIVLVGLTGYQQAGRDAIVLVGLTGYQRAGEAAVVGIGLAGYQRAKDAVGNISLIGCQRAERAAIVIGSVILQNVEKRADSLISLVILQKAGRLYQSFACWTDLQAPAEETA